MKKYVPLLVNKKKYKLYADDLKNIYQSRIKLTPKIPSYTNTSELLWNNFMNDEFKVSYENKELI